MRRPLASVALLCALSLALAGPLTGSAGAAGVPAADADCQAHGTLTKRYTVQQLKTAQAAMPADIKEYTNCPDVINHQLLVQLGKLSGSGGSGGGGGSFLPVWLIVVLALLVLGGAGLGLVAMRRSSSAPG
jgi:hypothetical protein